MSRPIPADPLPSSIVEGEAEDTTAWDARPGAPEARPGIEAAGTDHGTLLWLPGALRDRGVNVVELDGWARNQQDYYWTDETGHHRRFDGDPVGWAWHHTATSHYTPYVKNAKGQTKANLWMGLLRDGVLYATGGGVPTVVIASGGPANYSTGSGRKEVLVDFVARDRRFGGPQRGPDTDGFYGNRHYGTTETVHPGDGSPLDDGVWEIQLVVAAAMCAHYGWSPWRHIGHLDHTSRKIDPRFAQGAPYTIAFMQDSIPTDAPPVEPPVQPPPPDMEEDMRTVRFGDGMEEDPDPVVRAAQIMLIHHGYRDLFTIDKEFGADGVFREGTMAAVERFQGDHGLSVTGDVDAVTWKALDS